MKRAITLILAMVMVASCLAGCAQKQDDSAAKTNPDQSAVNPAADQSEGSTDAFTGEIVIGQIVTSITGAAAMYGDYIINSAQMAADEINAEGGINGKKVVIEYLDDQAQSTVALQCMQKLVDETNPLVVLGPDWSGNTLAAMPVAQEAGIPQLTSSKSRALTHSGNDSLFRYVASSHMVGQTLAQLAKDLGYEKIAIWYTNTEYGVGGGEGAKLACEQLGLEVVCYEAHNDSDNDFTAQIQAVKNSGADCLISYSIQTPGAKSLKQLREQGVDLPVLLGDAAITPDFAALVGDEYMEGCIATSAYVACDPSEGSMSYTQKYKELYGETPDDHGAPYYDMVKMLADVISKTGEDREAIIEGLKSVTDFEGAQGTYYCDEWGNMIHTCKVVEYKGGEWSYLYTVDNIEDFPD